MAIASDRSADRDRILIINRVFDAPRRVVWKAWAEPEQLVRWIGPAGFTAKILEFDPRPGGVFRFHMRGPDGTDHWQKGVFREIVEYERIVRTFVWTDADGSPTLPETLLTVEFEDLGATTRLTLRQEVFESVTARDLHRGGWSSALDKLAEHLAAA